MPPVHHYLTMTMCTVALEVQLEMKLLIAVDDSIFSQAAIDHVTSHGWPEGSEFRLLNVVDTQPFHQIQELGMHADAELKKRLVEKETSMLEGVASNMQSKLGPSILVGTEVKEGHVADTILETAKQFGADVIVLGSHSRTGVERLFLGSVAESVMLKAHCSVDIIKIPAAPEPPKEPFHRCTVLY